MNQPQTNSFWLLLEVLARRRRLIISVVLIATLATAGFSLMLPTWYRADALLLPPKEVASSEDKISSLREVVSVVQGLNLPVMVTSSDVFARMLESRTICDVLITKYDLIERYEVRTNRDAYNELMELSDFTVTDEGLLEISVEDQSPEMASDLANTFVSELDRVSRGIAQTRARQNRKFVEARVEQVRAQLDTAKVDFQNFQVINHTVDFREQTRLAVEQAIELKNSLAEIDDSRRRCGFGVCFDPCCLGQLCCCSFKLGGGRGSGRWSCACFFNDCTRCLLRFVLETLPEPIRVLLVERGVRSRLLHRFLLVLLRKVEEGQYPGKL